ncbi:MAG: hypothetical protein LBD09_00085 [Treponema sp.]|jgi:hypothetical protein|nr:hypothetical protein [Treponema sp.]
MEIRDLMDDELASRISREWNIDRATITRYSDFFHDTIKPVIRTKYLSHLVTTIENMVNDRRIKRISDIVTTEQEQLRSLLASRTFRLYSIVLVPIIIKRRATTRYHSSGAVIYYNSDYDEKTIRILIAHELGHIVDKELMDAAHDTEQTANLFALIAMLDKNYFYEKQCKRLVAKSDVQIFADIVTACPIKDIA